MATTNRYGIYPAQLVGGSTITLQQLHGVTITPGANKDVVIPGGAVDPSAIPMIFADSRVQFATHDLVTALGVSITAGFPITASSLIQWQARDNGGTFVGSGANVAVSLTKGWVGISSISASQDGPAELGLTVWPLYDGTNAPLVPAASQNLTSTPTFTSKFYLGPVTLNGTALNAVTGVSINPGIDYRTNRGSGDVYARVGSIYTRMPTISVTLADAGAAATVGNMFNASASGTVACYFSKGASGGSRVADATASHCKVSAAASVVNPESMSVSNNEDGSVTLIFQVTGTIAAVTNSALP